MDIRATDTELEVSGTPGELDAIAIGVSVLSAWGRVRFAAAPGADPAPYDCVLDGIEVEASGGPVCVAVVGGCVRVGGSPENLARFASFFAFPTDVPPGYHTHHEWWDGNEFIAPDSRPLVVRTV